MSFKNFFRYSPFGFQRNIPFLHLKPLRRKIQQTLRKGGSLRTDSPVSAIYDIALCPLHWQRPVSFRSNSSLSLFQFVFKHPSEPLFREKPPEIPRAFLLCVSFYNFHTGGGNVQNSNIPRGVQGFGNFLPIPFYRFQIRRFFRHKQKGRPRAADNHPSPMALL